MNISEEAIYDITPDLNDIAELILDITPAQSCLIFLPTEVISGQIADGKFSGLLQLAGGATVKRINEKHKSKSGTGIVGWVAKNKQIINIPEFSHSTQALGFYSEQASISSVIALPINLKLKGYDWHEETISGVLYCDSSEKNSFDQTTADILTKITKQVSKNVTLGLKVNSNIAKNLNFQEFYSRIEKLVERLGENSLQILRVKLDNSEEIEEKLGITEFVMMFQKMQRLIQQVLPPKYPVIHMPSGETLIVVDNMMGKYYENKIRIIAAHLNPDNYVLNYNFRHYPVTLGKNNKLSLDTLLSESETTPAKKKAFGLF